MPATSLPRLPLAIVAVASCLIGAAAAAHYAALDLTLSHYDAKAHLVVARRVADSLTPGWKQFGGVWLPLPHVLNAVPAQVDGLYRTGLAAVAISVAAFALAAVSIVAIVWRTSGSRLAALAAWTVFVTDPNTLYLQSTPMTEPLLLGLVAASVAAVLAWLDAPSPDTAWRPGLVIALACLTRYEAWAVSAALLGGALVVLWRSRGATRAALVPAGRDVLRLAAWPVGAVLLFLVNSRVSTGAWLVTGGFFVAENEALGRPVEALRQVGEGAVRLMGGATVALGALGLLVAIWWSRRGAERPRSRAWLAIALAATASLPVYAFLQGHPFRIRYMVALVLAVAAGSGLIVAVWPRRALRAVAAAGVAGLALLQTPPLDPTAPMVQEAQWDRPRAQARRAVTACLREGFDRPRHKVMASMGALAHYMQEMSHDGFRLDDFVHEGTDEIWPDALVDPRRHVQWLLFDEYGEGGDALTRRRQQVPGFAQGFTRVCEGGGVALYRRDDATDLHLP